MRAVLRTTGAVLAGFVTVVVLSTATDAVLFATGFFPPMGEPMSAGRWILATSYRFAFTFLGGWLTGRLALEPRMRAVWIGTSLGAVLGLVGVAVAVAKAPALGPLWYAIAVAISGPFACWWGGRSSLPRS